MLVALHEGAVRFARRGDDSDCQPGVHLGSRERDEGVNGAALGFSEIRDDVGDADSGCWHLASGCWMLGRGLTTDGTDTTDDYANWPYRLTKSVPFVSSVVSVPYWVLGSVNPCPFVVLVSLRRFDHGSH